MPEMPRECKSLLSDYTSNHKIKSDENQHFLSPAGLADYREHLIPILSLVDGIKMIWRNI